MEEEFLTIAMKPTFCRICVEVCAEQYCIYETVYKDDTLSMHMMMEKLVPSVFNAEQVKVDEFMCWPRKICAECTSKVLDAYDLYEQCMKSGDLLRECLSRKTETFIIEDMYDDAKQNFIIDTSPEHTLISSDDETKEQTPLVQRAPIKRVGRKLRFVASAQEDISEDKIESDMKEERIPISTDHDVHHLDGSKKHSTSACKKGSRKTSTRQKPASTKRSASSAAGFEKTPKGKKRTTRKVQESNDETLDETKEPETKVDIYRCLLCNASTYSSPKELTEHLKAEHPDQIHCCAQCPKVLMTKAAFEHHQYCHATGRSYFCMLCDKGFQTEQLLKNHVRTHTHGTGFLCSHCGQEFSNRSNLRQHLIRHTGDKPWQCTLCPSRFSMKSYLDRHQHTHTKAKYFSCDTCGSQFSRHYSLVKHQLIHTGDRYFTCEVCNMRFTSSHHVKRHMLTHTGEKPFKCTYCERSFTQSNDMVKHMKTHVGNNPYQCDRCDASFRLLTDLRNHYKDHCQSSSKDAFSGEEDKNISFTSTNILKIRFEKEMNQLIEKREENQTILARVTMDGNNDSEDQNLTIQLTFCRICAVLSTDEYGIYEIDYKDGTSNMHMMLEKLVPSVFNAEQVKVDELMGFPRKICGGCKGKVLEAYALYEMSMKSGDLLRKCLSGKKKTTFIVNITGGSMETADAQTCCPQKIKQAPARIWRKSQETIVDVTSEQIVPKDAYCKEHIKGDTCPILVDDHATPSEIEDQPSYSCEENDTISSSKVNDETNEMKQPRKRVARKRQTKAEKRTELVDQASYSGQENGRISSSKAKDESNATKHSTKRIVAKRQIKRESRSEFVDQPPYSGEENEAIFSSALINDETYEIKHPRKCVATKRQTKANKSNVQQAEQTTFNVSSEESGEPDIRVNQFRCLLCNESTYALPNELTDHLKTTHTDQIQCCEQCPKVFITKTAFEHHQYCHATGRSHFCVFCDKGFQTEQLLRNHLKTHTDGTGFLCSQCGKEFRDRSNLRQHEYRHTGHKPWQCNLCPSRFSTKGYLTVHLLTHSKHKAYSCDTCGSQFNRHYSLVKHQVIHTGVRHYECEVCKTRFASAHHVKIHMRRHTGEKPYKCGCCERGFAQKNDMLKHMKTHGQPYPCGHCDAYFDEVADLRIHLKVHEREGKSGNECTSVEQ
ncbi:zinc finger protein 235-like [Anopheles moucheti]|uniref:zinc finger protein 235-like n=1 Tax=Anopheles moucheti TaxID=186751 RepID=UPI0022F11BC0|nr:zinc finger protein 235-like [Anopheles moucheti]